MGRFKLQRGPDHLGVGGEGGGAKSIGGVGSKKSRKNQGVVAREEIGRGRTTTSIWGLVVVSRVREVAAAHEGQRMVGEGGAGLIASLEGLQQWVGEFLASRGPWGGCAGVHSTSRAMNLSSSQSCGVREPINFSSEAEIAHVKHGGIGHS